jgi:DnaK suppressor protein
MRKKTKFTKAQLQKFKKLFEKTRSDIMASIESAKSEEELDVEGDEVDIVQGAILSDIADALSKRDLNRLSLLDFALSKIEKGTFGHCESCDELINEKRLAAIPGCILCVSCAEQEELDNKQYASS